MAFQGPNGIKDASGKGGRRGFLHSEIPGILQEPQTPQTGQPSSVSGPRAGSSGIAVLCRPLVAAEPFAGHC